MGFSGSPNKDFGERTSAFSTMHLQIVANKIHTPSHSHGSGKVPIWSSAIQGHAIHLSMIAGSVFSNLRTCQECHHLETNLVQPRTLQSGCLVWKPSGVVWGIPATPCLEGPGLHVADAPKSDRPSVRPRMAWPRCHGMALV